MEFFVDDWYVEGDVSIGIIFYILIINGKFYGIIFVIMLIGFLCVQV